MTIHIKPVPGRLVRDPATLRPLPPEGIEVEETNVFWYRRLTAGDVSLSRKAGDKGDAQ
ncbi:MAG TPA: DUF2635 domain-containing protein [Stellaceae bacterium]|nr:DUF2635 domain-containing protein [Stellaceae bacterium]